MRRILLAIILLGILFPVAWIRDLSWEARTQFDALFSPEWVHWLMHTVLFAGLVLLLPISYRRPLRLVDALWLLGAILLTGVLQEIFQILQKGFLYLAGAVFDLGVDLGGGLVGLALAQCMARGREFFHQRKAFKHVEFT